MQVVTNVARDSGPRELPTQARAKKLRISRSFLEADDGARTRDLRLGKPTLYQLSYVRVGSS